MVSTRVSKRNSEERPKRQRRASTKFGESSGRDKEPSSENNDKKKKVDAATPKKTKEKKITPKTKKEEQQQYQQPKTTAAAKVAFKKAKVATVKNNTSSPKKVKKKTTTEIVEALPKTDNNDVSPTAVVQKEVRVRVRLEKKLNKGYRFARLNSSSKKNDRARKKPSVAKRSKPTVKKDGVVGGGGTREQIIRVRVKLTRDVRVRVRIEKKLMKGDRYALVNDYDMMSDDGEGQHQHLVASRKKKSLKITLRVSKKKTDGTSIDDDDVATNQKKRAKSEEPDDDDNEDDDDDSSDSGQSSPPPTKKAKISQFGNDIHPKRLCIIDGCDKYKKARCGGYCLLHYGELSDADKAEVAKDNELKRLKVAPEKKRCKVEGCIKYWKAKHDGFCLTCYKEHHDGEKDSSDELHEMDTTDSLEEEDSDEMTEGGSGPKSAKHCNFEGCMKYKQKGCVGYCLTHKAYANPEQRRLENEIAAAESAVKKKTTNKSSLCKFVGCDKYKQANCNGYCLQHVKSKKAYDDDDLEDVTKVRVRCDNRLQNGFCVAILSDDNRFKLGLERLPPMSDEDGGSDDGVEMEEQGKEPPSAVAKAGRPDFKVSNAIRRKENGALMCKAVGCPKIAQTKDDGFCRTHYNRFMISTGQCESWLCKCGEKIAITSLRCGKCHRWKNGHHPAYASSPQKSPVASPYAAPPQLRTHVPEDADVEISDFILRNERGRPLCKVIGCGKVEQAHTDGFCKIHFNEFAIPTDETEEDSFEKWTCECGEEWSVRQKRCGSTSCQKVGSLFKNICSCKLTSVSHHPCLHFVNVFSGEEASEKLTVLLKILAYLMTISSKTASGRVIIVERRLK